MERSQLTKLVRFREDLPHLFNRFGLNGIGVEVGVQRGDFSKHLLSYWGGKRLYLIDAWRTIDKYTDIANGDHNIQLDNFAKTFMSVYEYEDRAVIIRDLSVSASTLFQDKSLDFVFIDANHAYEAVKEDLGAWFPKIKSGGVFCGHDYLNSKYDPKSGAASTTTTANSWADFEVKRAVDEWASKNNIEIFTSCDDDAYPFWWCRL